MNATLSRSLVGDSATVENVSGEVTIGNDAEVHGSA